LHGELINLPFINKAKSLDLGEYSLLHMYFFIFF
jgi:hypothetical protein